MLRAITGSTVSALILCLGFVINASADGIVGGYSYTYTNTIADASCTAPANGTRDNFVSTSGGNSIDASDSVSFSICDGATGLLVGGEFLINDGGGNEFGGVFSGVLTGISGGGGDIFDGNFAATLQTGTYLSVTYPDGVFEVVTGQVNTPAFLTGTFDFDSTPEPVTAVFAGSGLLLLSVSRKLLKRRA